jgi:hypothetical protein
MANTTNFGWETPDDTDLVKDGAAAMRTLGNSIDASFVDLKGGTTNQVLAKNSNTDLDFKWVADATGIPATIFDAKGDIIAATAADTADRLAVGANNTVLTADSSTATGLKWAVPSAGVTNWTLLNSGGTALTGAATVTVSGISGQKQILVLVSAASSANANSWIRLRINTDTAANYSQFGMQIQARDPYDVNILQNVANYSTATSIDLGKTGSNAGGQVSGGVFIDQADQTGWKRLSVSAAGTDASHSGNFGPVGVATQGFYEGSAAITSISILSSSGDLDAGTVYVLGGA